MKPLARDLLIGIGVAIVITGLMLAGFFLVTGIW